MAENFNAAEKKFILETKIALRSKNDKQIIAKLRELKEIGNVNIFPFILELLESSNSADIIEEVLGIIRDLRDQRCVPVIVEYIEKNKTGVHLGGVISSCWQSRLDFHAYLNSFATPFIYGDYQTALEAFTVIEEMLWKSSDSQIMACRNILVENSHVITAEKKPLYHELIKVLDEGKSNNADNYPDLYEN
jgi:hypothetical protein